MRKCIHRRVTIYRIDVNLLTGVQIMQRFGKQINCIVHERGFRLQHVIFNKMGKKETYDGK